jgi:uncharacterized protein (DUF983 family)
VTVVPERPPARVALWRGLACRCPRCGIGAVFVRRLIGADRCSHCGFRFVRGVGHHLGGAEVNVLVTFPVGVLAAAVPAIVWGASYATAAAGGLLAAILGLAVQRPARAVFYAIDYLVEPDWTPGDEDDDDDRGGGGEPDTPVPLPGGGGKKLPLVELPVPLPAPRPDAEPDPRPAPLPDPVRVTTPTA